MRPDCGTRDRTIVIGAGVDGLAAAVCLAARGLDVTVVEKAAAPGGKMREVPVAGTRIDGGPTVFTMRHILDEIFATAGTTLEANLTLEPVGVLARHGWGDGARLDLFADIDRSVDAIAAFSDGRNAAGYRRFCADAAAMFRTLDATFMRAPAPAMGNLVRGASLRDLWGTKPFSTMWAALGGYFTDPRLRQLFGRYATYCGSSPFQAPATLMLVAHVEQAGVWLVQGGMHRVARALEAVAAAKGAVFRYGTAVRRILTEGGRVSGVELEDGERLPADRIVYNGDAGALGNGLLGPAGAAAAPAQSPAARSLSALTWTAVAPTAGFPLLRHTVFFSDDYPAEFRDIFRLGRLPENPTVYICAQDRGDQDVAGPQGPERLLILVNAPARGDTHPLSAGEIDRCTARTFAFLERCGLRVDLTPDDTVTTSPTGFHSLFPGTGGAIYGRASHGWQASFARPGVRSRIPGLYLAGGSVHPGPGVPMAALSGRTAAACLLANLEREAARSSASTGRSRTTVMPGGMSTP